MTYSLVISLILTTIATLNLPNVIETQNYQAGYFNVKHRNKVAPINSLNLIKTLQTDEMNCLAKCSQNISCNVAIYNSNGWCTLCKPGVLNELINSASGETTCVHQIQGHVSDLTNGLIHYWPISNDLNDYMGSSDMTAGSLEAGETVGFVQDRFNNTNGAIFTNPGYYILPPGIYFYTTFSFLVWVKVFEFTAWSRIIDCGNGPNSDNILVSLSYVDFGIPYSQIYENSSPQSIVMPTSNLTAYQWFHLASVYDGQNMKMYVNGNLVANSVSKGPNVVQRTQCYIGRSNYHLTAGDADANACFDDLMIFSRALTPSEVQIYMNYVFS